MTKEEDALEAVISKVLDAKLDAVLKPILAKLDAQEEKKDEEETDEEKKKKKKAAEEKGEKKDSLSIATATLRAKLDGFIKPDELSKMSLFEMSNKLAHIQNAINPSQRGNQIHEKNDEKDIFTDDGTKMEWD